MPIYEYKCQACDRKFELLRKRSEADAGANCPKCKGAKTKRVMSGFFGRSGSTRGESASVAGGGGCGGCRKSSCAGCHH